MSSLILNRSGYVWKQTPELKDAHLYSAPPFVNVPGATNLITEPIQLYFGVKTLVQARRTKDTETKYDALVKSIGAPFNLANAAGQIAEYGSNAKVFKIGKMMKVFAKITAIFGIVVCSVEMALTVRDIRRNNKLLKLIDKPGTLEETLERIFKKFFQVKTTHPQKLLATKVRLAKRVRKWLVLEMDKNLPRILKGLKSKDPLVKAQAIHDGQLILDQLRQQTEKHAVFNAIALTSLIVTALGLALFLAYGTKTSTPFVLTGFGIGALGYVAHKGMMDNRGLTFEGKKAIPEFIRKKAFQLAELANRCFRKITCQKKPKKWEWKADKMPTFKWANKTEIQQPALSPQLQQSVALPPPSLQPRELCTHQGRKPVGEALQGKPSHFPSKHPFPSSRAQQALSPAQALGQSGLQRQYTPLRKAQRSQVHCLQRQKVGPSGSQKPLKASPFHGVVDEPFLAQIRQDLDHLQELISQCRKHMAHSDILL